VLPHRNTFPRFWAKVSVTSPSRCWLWTACKTAGGYGRIRMRNHLPRVQNAHRVAYELLVGAIPKGLDLDHLCRVPACVNPYHLEPVTRRENTLRGENPPAWNNRKTHCMRGHEFSSENTYRRPDGTRECYACRKLIDRSEELALKRNRYQEAHGMGRNKPGIFQDPSANIYYGLQSEFPTAVAFLAGIEDIQGDKFPSTDVVRVYARFCVAQCGWHEYSAYDGFWHIEHERGPFRTKAWQLYAPEE